jgi:hypothetical protein
MATKTSARRKGGARKSTSRTRTPARKTAARSAASPASSPTMARPSKGISRIDQPSRRTHGFFVRLDYRKTPEGYRPRLVAFFGDASHGGKRAAWKAAEEWANRMRPAAKRGAKGAAKSAARGTRKRASAAKRR